MDTFDQSEQSVTIEKAVAKGHFNYDILIKQFGLNLISEDIINSLEKVIKEPISYFLTRQIFFAHQDFDKIIDAKQKGKDIYIYTGRGPSADSMHIGHLLPMMFTVWLQKIFDCWVVIEMSDEEKYYFKDGTLDEFMNYTKNNALDIIACGFNPEKTFIFSSFKYQTYMRPLIACINKKMSVHVTNKIYGFNENNNIGQLQWPAYQIAPSFCGAFPHLFGNRKDVMCLIPCAVDQVPYFRESRDIAESLGYPKPALICSKFLVGLQGVGEKASTTSLIAPIFLNDTEKIIETKIKKYAFSGGKVTLQEHKMFGADLNVDVSYIYLCYFLEDDIELKKIATNYKSGIMLTSEIKKIISSVLWNILNLHQQQRKSITDLILNKFFTLHIQPHVLKDFTEFKKKYLDLSC